MCESPQSTSGKRGRRSGAGALLVIISYISTHIMTLHISYRLHSFVVSVVYEHITPPRSIVRYLKTDWMLPGAILIKSHMLDPVAPSSGAIGRVINWKLVHELLNII